jgi:glycosyltransferase involved in cell wall biosynthesis
VTAASVNTPRVTVLMPVYNGGEHLRTAIGSILAQTFADFELLVINDGSTDDSAAIVRSYNDPRIRLVENNGNLGLIATLNSGLQLARGEYLARMDCDDVSRPYRLEKQVALLDHNPAIGICGAWVRKFGAVPLKVCRYHTSSDLLKCGLLFDSVLAHPAVMLRRNAFIDSGLWYDHAYRHAEDYQLWSQVAKLFRLGNVPEVLLDYRIHPSQVSRAHSPEQLANAGLVRRSLLAELGLDPDEEQFEIQQRISTYSVSGYADLFRSADEWLCRIWEANRRTGCYPEPELSLILAERLVTLLKKMLEKGIMPDRRMFRPQLLKVSGIGWSGAAVFMLRSITGGVKNA